jgi:hypothetical protein
VTSEGLRGRPPVSLPRSTERCSSAALPAPSQFEAGFVSTAHGDEDRRDPRAAAAAFAASGGPPSAGEGPSREHVLPPAGGGGAASLSSRSTCLSSESRRVLAPDDPKWCTTTTWHTDQAWIHRAHTSDCGRASRQRAAGGGRLDRALVQAR